MSKSKAKIVYDREGNPSLVLGKRKVFLDPDDSQDLIDIYGSGDDAEFQEAAEELIRLIDLTKSFKKKR